MRFDNARLLFKTLPGLDLRVRISWRSRAGRRELRSCDVSTATATAASEPEAEASEAGGLWVLLDSFPAWGVSLLVHAAIILIVAMIPLVEIVIPQMNLESSVEPEVVRQEVFEIDTAPTENLGSQSVMNVLGESAAVAQDKGLDNHVEQVEQLESELVDPKIPQLETVAVPNEAEMLENVDLTGTTEHAGGTDGAVDRITLEIANSLRQRKTIPVWIFDESGSMTKRRDRIVERFENIYRQLGLMEDIDTQNALLTGVIGFGQDVHVVVEEPTNDLDALVKGVRSLKEDTSGFENVAAALDKALKTYGPVRRKLKANMMVIIVSDERGDDFGEQFEVLEALVRKCTKDGIRIFAIGNTSVFGRKEGRVWHQWEFEGEKQEGFIEVDQGPETPKDEALRLPYWTANAGDLSVMSAGFGPYGLSRMCAETGGIFFIADDTGAMKWDPEIMRRYAPDYRPASEYMRQVQANLAKQALLAAAQLSVSENVPIPQRSFQANNDNVLREQITEAQKPLAEMDYFLTRMHEALEAGEKHRDKLDSDRWRAGYDLAMGRVLAMRVRAFGYNSILAEMKASPRPFEKAGSNQWVLEPSDEINSGATVRRMHDKALEYLNRVVSEHPGTPWAYLAKVELSEPLGWKWKERTMQVAQMQPQVDRNSPQFAEEEERQRQARERQRRIEQNKPRL
jgi:hypothetical protein